MERRDAYYDKNYKKIKSYPIAMDEIYLTRSGYEKLMEELQFLKKDKRRQLSKAIGEARAQGDISENAEYEAAKEAQGLNEKKIAELESKLAQARILDDESMSSDEVLIGASVTIRDLDSQEVLEYILVSETEADYNEGKISITSPVGAALMNHKEKDIVEIKVPAGILKYEILKISR
ncbi:MAG: transcription elongation factor GreA [Candidatus Omnitrophica bacterium]|nr:transcription elongation factor GreA [Candidatus Omnitrophota bacterium]